MTILSQPTKDFWISFVVTLILTAIFGGIAGYFLTKNKGLSAFFTVFPTKTITLLIVLYFFRDKKTIDRRHEITLYLNQLYKYLLAFTLICFIAFIVLNKGKFIV